MLPAQLRGSWLLPPCAALCAQGMPREGQAGELWAGAPAQVFAAFLCLWESHFIPSPPQNRENKCNKYIYILVLFLKASCRTVPSYF